MKHSIIAFLFLAVMVQQAQAAAPVYKCVKHREVTYQSEPCAKPLRRTEPNIKKLNEERMKKLLESDTTNKATKSANDGQLSVKDGEAAVAPAQSSKTTSKPTVSTAKPASTFKCDGRTHCSHMTSCAEAKYFLNNCPGVKMDGDRDGIPCEEQWCRHPFSD
ncbi:MAG TPA: excalibur calcium-binding domain-containing protein [Burkholderiaceae bacterium]|nr:excalibur calcium-binding domain-containing protein [Burkholderiaceae bacterium]